MAISIPASRITPKGLEKLAKPLCAAADDLSAELGYRAGASAA